MAGYANQSAIVSAADANSVFGSLNAVTHLLNVVNLSGIVSTADANMMFGNLNVASQVP
jgi:cysteine sulfinate desulfinase/cysteine desulfurase-like protein